jgi:predicted methyltransferase
MIILGLFLVAACGHENLTEKPVSPPSSSVARPFPRTLAEAVNSELRSEKNKLRDPYRHPLDTLNFFDIQPNQVILEILPASGWYTEILAPYVVEKGTYVAALKSTNMVDSSNADLQAWLQKNPDVASKISVVEFAPSKKIKLGEDGAVDRVLTFRNVHNWMKSNHENEVFKAFYRVLKPGGILGVVEHRAEKNTKFKHGEKGYVSEDAVIAMATKAGFKLAGKSEINANPKDTKDYAEGVWTLPPTLKLGEKGREKYTEIGESDRMTLKFVKP